MQSGRWPLRRPIDMLAVDDVFYGGQTLGGGDSSGGGSGGGSVAYSYSSSSSSSRSLRLADAGGAAAEAAIRALESYVYRYALRELRAGDASARTRPCNTHVHSFYESPQ